MKTIRLIVALLFVVLAASVTALHAADADDPAGKKEKKSESIFYTFAGLIGEGGSNHIVYSDWVTDKWETIEYNGSYGGGGLVLALYADHLIGEFSLQYISSANAGTPDVSASYTMATALGKFAWFFFDVVGVAGGVGMYLEIPPFKKDYTGGAGFAGSIGLVFNLGTDVKIFVDGIARTGRFGFGEESTITSFGGRIGVMYNVGRL
ncbi:MAG TPA: hypothetical protein PLG31_08715 [Spirochaetota bacterium]|nr:hypothetical protein [Spirochaetota bacterium]